MDGDGRTLLCVSNRRSSRLLPCARLRLPCTHTHVRKVLVKYRIYTHRAYPRIRIRIHKNAQNTQRANAQTHRQLAWSSLSPWWPFNESLIATAAVDSIYSITVFANTTNISANIETAMLSTAAPLLTSFQTNDASSQDLSFPAGT